ncbi:TetR/AcrR family transcriptional regulator [Mycobacterium sp. NPDC003449]
MSSPARPLRADAVRNRARVLEVAYQAFATDGLMIAIDEIARRAGVGAGTVYRHFPTKDLLVQAVLVERMRSIVESGRAFLKTEGPEDALFVFIRSMVLDWGADRGLVETLAGSGFDFDKSVPDAEKEFRNLLRRLLHAAQRAGTARRDVSADEVKALMIGCQASQMYDASLAESVTRIALDGLRPR